jgi:hypothetical protein
LVGDVVVLAAVPAALGADVVVLAAALVAAAALVEDADPDAVRAAGPVRDVPVIAAEAGPARSGTSSRNAFSICAA